jgi:histidinol dehydrogenase
MRSVQQIEYSQDALRDVANPLQIMATDEDLPAHFEAINARFSQ